MVRKNFFIEQEQIDLLNSLGGTIAVHVRRAIDDYIHVMRKTPPTAKQSPSKGGNINAR